MSQATKEDLAKMDTVPIDAAVPIVTLIIDCTTDHRNFHFCKGSQAVSDFSEEVKEEDGKVEKSVLDLAASLAGRRTKDMVPLAVVASHIAGLGNRCHASQKILHVLLTGCNTNNLVLPIRQKLEPAAQSSVWVLATTQVWPGDMSTFLWSQYGAMVSTDLAAFRVATRIILDEYTTHWKRQKIKDEAMSEQVKSFSSLADLAVLDRLDRVEDEAGYARMQPL
jgi:hypothetical protein